MQTQLLTLLRISAPGLSHQLAQSRAVVDREGEREELPVQLRGRRREEQLGGCVRAGDATVPPEAQVRLSARCREQLDRRASGEAYAVSCSSASISTIRPVTCFAAFRHGAMFSV